VNALHSLSNHHKKFNGFSETIEKDNDLL